MLSEVSIACILVHWHCPGQLLLCLESLLPSFSTLPLRIIVVNNDSSPPLPQSFLDTHPQIRIIAAGRNLGFAAACNLGASLTEAPYLLFLNPDITALAGSLESMVSWMISHPDAGGVGGMLLTPRGRPQYGFMARRLPTLKSMALDFSLIGKLPWFSFRYHGYGPGELSTETATQVEQPAAACLLLRRDVFQSVQGFDADFWPAWFEDVDLCFRLRKNRIPLFFLPSARFYHAGGASLDTLLWTDFVKFYHRNLLLYFRKNHSQLSFLCLRFLILLGVLLRLFLLPLAYPQKAGSRRSAWYGYWEILKVLFRFRYHSFSL